MTRTCSTSPTSRRRDRADPRARRAPDRRRSGARSTGSGAALIFEKPSNRTRHSMEMAVVQLGGHPVYTRGDEVGFDTREPVEDIAKIMEGYHALDRRPRVRPRVVDADGRGADVPVVNMLTDRSHPLQAFADALTMQQCLGDLAGKTVAYVGDYNNVLASLGEISAALGMHVRLACPTGSAPTRPSSSGSLLLGARRSSRSTRPSRRSPAPTPSTPTRGCRWARRPTRRPPAGVRGVHRRRRDDGARRPGRGVHALPARLPRVRGDRRRDRRPASRSCSSRAQPAALGPGALAFLDGGRR